MFSLRSELDNLGTTPRQSADHLGDARPSTTLDVDIGCRVVMAAAAATRALPAVGSTLPSVIGQVRR